MSNMLKIITKAKEELKQEIMYLIKKAGYDPNVNKELADFAYLGGRTEDGISNDKIKMVLNDNMLPREDFLYALALIAVKVNGEEEYYQRGIKDPFKYKLEGYLQMCGYDIEPGERFPYTSKFRKNSVDREDTSMLAAIPNIFWDVNIPFEDIVSHIQSQKLYGERRVNIGSGRNIIYGSYNYIEHGNPGPIGVTSVKEDNNPDIFGFKLINTDARLHIKSIEAIRSHQNAWIQMVLLNGHWVEFTNSKTEMGEVGTAGQA